MTGSLLVLPNRWMETWRELQAPALRVGQRAALEGRLAELEANMDRAERHALAELIDIEIAAAGRRLAASCERAA